MPNISTTLSTNLLDDLNSDQKQAVLASEGPTLILAGAGSGKTKVLTYRVAYLISEKKIPPENICVLTFTNKAAGGMKERILKLLYNEQPAKGEARQLPTMGTFHSFCARILRREGKALGLAPNFSIYDEADALDAVKEAMKNLDISTKKTSPSSVRAVISSAKNEMVSSLEYVNLARGFFQETVAKIYLEYQKILDQNQAVDFDDLLLLTVKLFQNFPEILTKHQIIFRYILIDEYQDTNPVQYILSKLLSGRVKNICVVGDASQSIYAFRGADFRNIINFQRDFPGAKVFNLEQNYRSTQNILDAAFAVISKNRTHPILKLWTDNVQGAKIQIIEARNEVEEALFIATTIKQILDTTHTTNHELLTMHSFAILYRTNAQSRALEEIFLKAEIPYILVGGIRFYERKEIKDILAYLRLVENPKDSISKKRVGKIGKGRMNKFLKFLEEINSNLANYTTCELLDQILETTDYLNYINDGTEVGKARIENVKELRSVAQQFPSLTEFLEQVALVESEYSTDEKHKKSHIGGGIQEAVTLTTLHQAKGLEWPVVFMAGMEEGLFPHSRCLLDPNEMEEERRLCYVGITRAKQRLYMIHTRQRLYFGAKTNNLVSRFIIDIPENLIEGSINLENRDQFLDDITLEQDDDDWLNI